MRQMVATPRPEVVVQRSEVFGSALARVYSGHGGRDMRQFPIRGSQPEMNY